MNKKMFTDKYCKGCKSECEGGLVETYSTLYCKDRDIKETKNHSLNELVEDARKLKEDFNKMKSEA